MCDIFLHIHIFDLCEIVQVHLHESVHCSAMIMDGHIFNIFNLPFSKQYIFSYNSVLC